MFSTTKKHVYIKITFLTVARGAITVNSLAQELIQRHCENQAALVTDQPWDHRHPWDYTHHPCAANSTHRRAEKDFIDGQNIFLGKALGA